MLFQDFLFSQLFAMNAAAPEGTPPRRINNREDFRKHGTATPCPGGPLRRGAFISAIFTVLVRTLRSYPVLQSSFIRIFSCDPVFRCSCHRAGSAENAGIVSSVLTPISSVPPVFHGRVWSARSRISFNDGTVPRTLVPFCPARHILPALLPSGSVKNLIFLAVV